MAEQLPKLIITESFDSTLRLVYTGNAYAYPRNSTVDFWLVLFDL